jgi:anti-sigma B factor antagonist
VSAGESGPVITLSGETDVTTVAGLSELVTAQLGGGTRHLTIDVSELSFADSASIRVLVLAARTLRQRGGALVLLRPNRALARMLEIMGADQLITIWGETELRPGPAGEAGEPPEVSPEPPGL